MCEEVNHRNQLTIRYSAIVQKIFWPSDGKCTPSAETAFNVMNTVHREQFTENKFEREREREREREKERHLGQRRLAVMTARK